MTNENKKFSDAKERVELKMGFYAHLTAFVVVNAGLTAVDLTTSPDKLWFFWPLGGWGIGLALHGLKVFGSDTSKLNEVKERMIEREMARE